MMRNTFILVSLLHYSFLMYFPLTKKDIELNNDDLCYYKETEGKEYVKPCNKGYNCSQISTKSGICFENKPIFKKYKEVCNESDCHSGLICGEEKLCILKGNSPYIVEDKFSKIKYYYCPDDKTPKETECVSQSGNVDKCPDENGGIVYFKYLKVCGEYIEDNKSALSEFGEIEDNKKFKDVLACKSGFALF